MTRRKKVLFLTVSITLFLIPVVLALSAQTRVKEPSKSLRKLKVQKIRATVKKGRKVKKKAVVKKGKYVFSKKRLSKKELQASKKRIASVKPEMRKAAEEIEKLRETAITQEDRERAANRLKTKTKNKSTAFVNPGPGDTPDYSGLTANWAFSPPLRKFVDSLPGLGPTKANNLGQYLSVAVPDTVTYPGSDYYEIELRQYTEKMHSDLQPITHRVMFRLITERMPMATIQLCQRQSAIWGQ